MNIPNLFRPCSCALSRSFSVRQRSVHVSRRWYATYRDTEPSVLSQSLDTKQRTVPSGDSVGPFRLGLAQSSLRKDEKVLKWSELSTGGKGTSFKNCSFLQLLTYVSSPVVRTTARTTNLTVILVGAGLSALLIYSLTTELFSKNSPTVLYGEACERIKASPKVCSYRLI